MWNLLKRLPAGQQEVMQLRLGHGLRCAEIASIVGKREIAVRTTLSGNESPAQNLQER